jgi:xanthine/uracil permease
MERGVLLASETANENILFEPDEGCPPLTAIITGFQLAIVMIALVVVPVVIVVRTAEQPESYLT